MTRREFPIRGVTLALQIVTIVALTLTILLDLWGCREMTRPCDTGGRPSADPATWPNPAEWRVDTVTLYTPAGDSIGVTEWIVCTSVSGGR